jgi:hypothetical protein
MNGGKKGSKFPAFAGVLRGNASVTVMVLMDKANTTPCSLLKGLRGITALGAQQNCRETNVRRALSSEINTSEA